MNNIILCEGFDDAMFLGYFIHKTCNSPKWSYTSKTKLSKNFDLPKTTRNQKSELYVRNTDKLAICAVGGKDSFESKIEFVLKINYKYPDERFQQLVIVRDKDTDNIDDIINYLQNCFQKYTDDNFSFVDTVKLSNMQNINIQYTKNDVKYSFNVAVIIVPFDKNGAIETLLSTAISQRGKEEEIICQLSNNYIDNCLNNDQISNYLTCDREELKARFSALISVINPTKSTALFNEMFMDYEWENSPYIQENFKLLKEIFK